MNNQRNEHAGLHESDSVRTADDSSQSDVRSHKVKAIEEALNGGTSREVAEAIVEALELEQTKKRR